MLWLGKPTAQPDRSDYPASRPSICRFDERGGRYAQHVVVDACTSRSKPRAELAGSCAGWSPRDTDVLRGIRRRRHAVSLLAEIRCLPSSRRVRVRVGAFRQAGQLRGPILHPIGRVTLTDSGIVTKKPANVSGVLEWVWTTIRRSRFPVQLMLFYRRGVHS
jgi:hypothetical protein